MAFLSSEQEMNAFSMGETAMLLTTREWPSNLRTKCPNLASSIETPAKFSSPLKIKYPL
jgi:hypothetical protein